jgi:hypothetical protein
MRIIDTNIESPTRGQYYTLVEVLSKGLQRAALTCKTLKVRLAHKCFYGSRDYVVSVEELGPSKSLWTDSVNFSITADIPVHATKDGKLSIGFGCGCDKRHGGFFPSEGPPDNPKWEEYKNSPLDGEIYMWTDEGSQQMSIEYLIDIYPEGEECKLLLRLVKEVIARRAFI